jgi:hypothetical protein
MASRPLHANAQQAASSDSCSECGDSGGNTCPPGSSSSFSAFPIRYATGEIQLNVQDLGSTDFGVSWGHTRSYSNLVTSPDEGINGSSWFIKEVPQIVNVDPDPTDPNKATICVIQIITEALWFDYVATDDSYKPRFFTHETLVHDATNKQFILTNARGEITAFFDFDSTRPSALRGQFKSFTDAYGRETLANYNESNLIASFVQRSGGQTAGYHYAYHSGGANIGRLQFVTYRINGENVRRAKYDYYDGLSGFGSVGDLKRATVQQFTNSSWSAIAISYYRYYKAGDSDGFEHGLKYVLTPVGYARMVELGITPEISTDAQLRRFAQHHFRYTAQKGVHTEMVRGGSLTYNYARTHSANVNNYNSWKTKAIESLPDGNQNIVYANHAGQVILKVFLETETNQQWYNYFQYNNQGQIILAAESSAVAGYSESSPELVTLNANNGLIHIYNFYPANPPADGAPHYIHFEKVQEGGSGTPIILTEWKYVTRTVGDVSIYVPWKEICYPSDTDQTLHIECTVYTYTWQGDFQVDEKTTIWPVVSAAQNGSGTADRKVEKLDATGRTIWTKDERGYITGFSYDAVTGAIVQKVEDASVGTPWTPLPGPHLNLTTDYTVDSLGRTIQELGPSHDIDLNGTNTTVRRAKWTVYQDATYQQWEASGYQSVSDGSYTLINPVSLTLMDEANRVTDEIQAIRTNTSGPLLPTDSFPQSSYVRWTKSSYINSLGLKYLRTYFTIPDSGFGVEGTNYNQTKYNYDSMIRLVREKSPGDTITRTVYHPMGWVLEKWIGTNDAGATAKDPSGGGFIGNDMVMVESFEYDNNLPGGDGNQTQQTECVDATVARVTNYGYDWRDRQTVIDGEIDFYQITTYDNQDRAIQVNRRNTNSSGNLIGRTVTNYDDRGRVYQTITYGVDPATGTVGNPLVNNSWYDPSSNLIKQESAGSSTLQKMLLDALARTIKQYTSYDTAETGYPYPVSVASDTVFQQIETAFDAASNVILQTTRERFHNATGTGELTSPTGVQPKARVSYLAYWPDALGRAHNVANYGTNGGTALTRPNTAPARSDTVLITTIDYNDRGEAYQVTDPKGAVNESTFDDAGRLVILMENYVPGGGGSDQNRETDYAYNADGKLLTLTAINSTTGNQVTQYVYGTTLENSDIASNNLLHRVIYPDDSDTSPDRVTTNYNRQGETKQKVDQLGTKHIFEYDLLGRLLHDRVTILGSGVDGTIRRISYTYEVRGMVQGITGYNHAAVDVGGVVNDVQFVYNNFSQLITEYQSHSGAVNTGTTPKVRYGYADGSANIIRPTSVTYADGRVLTYDYGAAGAANDLLSRIQSLIDDDGTHLADYTYLGLNQIVQVESPQPD